tara:strand:+ start:270 stop:1274 length:1005 start_codon:yes stop_codon:yes gene_type:complete
MLFFRVFLNTLGFLSALAIFILVLNIVILVFSAKNSEYFNFVEGDKNSKNIIAVLNINGPIISGFNEFISQTYYNYIDPKDVVKKLRSLEKIKPDILIIKINTPGGTVNDSAELEKIITNFKKNNKLKIYFYTESILTSGGYWVATSGDKIFAKYGSIIGSIGVSGPNWYYYKDPTSINTGIFGKSIKTKNGIEVFSQNAGNFKDLYNPFRRPSDTELNHLNNIVQEIYTDFINLVSRSRKIEKEIISKDIGALIYTSQQAKNKYLIDREIYYNELIEEIINYENFDNYKIIENKTNLNILQKYFAIFNNDKNIFCNKLNTSFIAILPNYLKSC